MKKTSLKALCVGLVAFGILAAGGAVGIAAIATNGFKNNENITPNLSMNFINYGETYTKQGVESALVGAGYEIKDLKLRSYLDADYWAKASFKENKTNFLTKTEMKAFTEEDHEKSITLNNVAQNAYGSFGSKVDIAFTEDEGFYIGTGSDFEVEIVGHASIMYNPEAYDLVVAITPNYVVSSVNTAANMKYGTKDVHEELALLSVSDGQLPLVLAFDIVEQ